MVHRDGRLLHANQAYADLKGYASPEDAVARHIVGSGIHPEDLEMVRSRIAANAQRDAPPTRYECRLLRPDGGVVWVECMASRVDWDGARRCWRFTTT